MDEKQYHVVQSLALYEHFQYGAAKKRLGIFGSAVVGGDFTTVEWFTDWDNYKYYIYRLHENL